MEDDLIGGCAFEYAEKAKIQLDRTSNTALGLLFCIAAVAIVQLTRLLFCEDVDEHIIRRASRSNPVFMKTVIFCTVQRVIVFILAFWTIVLINTIEQVTIDNQELIEASGE